MVVLEALMIRMTCGNARACLDSCSRNIKHGVSGTGNSANVKRWHADLFVKIIKCQDLKN